MVHLNLKVQYQPSPTTAVPVMGHVLLTPLLLMLREVLPLYTWANADTVVVTFSSAYATAPKVILGHNSAVNGGITATQLHLHSQPQVHAAEESIIVVESV